MSDRIFGIAWLLVCVVIVSEMWALTVPFAYEPVGPKAFPMLLAGLMAICCIFLIARPDTRQLAPNVAVLRKGALLIGVLLAYAYLFEKLGFAASTAAMVLIVSRIFGGSWRTSGVSSVTIAVVGFFVFDRLLEVSLPAGLFWG